MAHRPRRWRALFSAALLFAPLAARAQPDISDDALLRRYLWQRLRSLPAGERPKVGLVLSAGSIRAVAHVGVLSVLADAGFPIDVVAGTSMGAVLGSLFSAGMPPQRIQDIALSFRPDTGNNLNAFRLITLLISDNLLSSKRSEDFIKREIGDKRFADLRIPFACVAMDFNSGEEIIFREGPLAPAVRASMNLPGVFAPVAYRQRYLVDGGVVDYIPVDAAKLLGADWTLASVTEIDYSRSRPQTVLQSLEQVIDIRGSLLAREQKRQADFVIAPRVGDIGLYQSGRADEAVDKGTIAAHSRIDAAMESLILYTLRHYPLKNLL